MLEFLTGIGVIDEAWTGDFDIFGGEFAIDLIY